MIRLVTDEIETDANWLHEVTMEIAGDGVYIEVMPQNGNLLLSARFPIAEVKTLLENVR